MTKCARCGIQLEGKQVVVMIGAEAFCSSDCGMTKVGSKTYETYAEEVNAESIGIRKKRGKRYDTRKTTKKPARR